MGERFEPRYDCEAKGEPEEQHDGNKKRCYESHCHYRHVVLHQWNPANVPQYVEQAPAKAAPASSISSVVVSNIFIVSSSGSGHGVCRGSTQRCKTTHQCVTCAA